MGVETLIELEMFNEMISQKILNVYDKIENKNKIIPIIDVRHFEIPNYQYICDKIHKYYSNIGYCTLFLTYKYPKNHEEIPIFFPIYNPEYKYSKLIKQLENSISYDAIVATHSYSFFHKKNYEKGLNDWMQRDEENFIIIDGKRICKSLTQDKNVAIMGVISEKRVIDKVIFNIGEEKTELDIEYLKTPKRKSS